MLVYYKASCARADMKVIIIIIYFGKKINAHSRILYICIVYFSTNAVVVAYRCRWMDENQKSTVLPRHVVNVDFHQLSPYLFVGRQLLDA